jgi:hypothetical protein
MKKANSSKTAIYAALIGNLLVAVTKFIRRGTERQLVDAERGRSLASRHRQRAAAPLRDAALGAHARPAHPLGYGRELYFWSFIVAVLLFALGAGVSIYQGVARVRTPSPVTDVIVVYIVLALSFVFEGVSWRVSQRAFRVAKGDLGYWEAVRKSKDPPSFIVLFEDSAH